MAAVAEKHLTLEEFRKKYALDVVVEVLSPGDQFSIVHENCERYSGLGIQDILVLNPVRHKASFWHSQMRSLLSAYHEYEFHSNRTLTFENVWTRLDEEK